MRNLLTKIQSKLAMIGGSAAYTLLKLQNDYDYDWDWATDSVDSDVATGTAAAGLATLFGGAWIFIMYVPKIFRL